MRIVLGQVLAFPYILRGPAVIIFLAKDTDFKVGFRVAISPTGISQFPLFPTPLSLGWARLTAARSVCPGAGQTYLPLPGTGPAFWRWQNRTGDCCVAPGETDGIVLLTKKKLLELQRP